MAEMDLNDFNAALSVVGDRGLDSVEYHRLGELVLRHPLTPRLQALDPFSAAYKETVLQLYCDLRGDDRVYDPARDEQSGMVLPANPWSGASPWNFRDPGFVSEFLFSWGQIMRALALPPGSDAKILEYGSGSGQLLLFLARLGLRTYAVDIDAASLQLVRTQATAMQLDVRTEQAAFGGGFGNETFDRIIFFEAFHHAINFGPLLSRLRQRLNPGGLLILCGEPIVGAFVPAVPYPWGPRLDGLSIFCIRRYGWMELGFTEPFLIEALNRNGWLVDITPLPGCGRATTYVARSYVGSMIDIGGQVRLGPYEAGWEDREGTHRWTRGGGTATFPLPDQDGPSHVTIRAGNPFPKDIEVTLYDGEKRLCDAVVPAGSDNQEIVFGPCYRAFFGMRTVGIVPIDVWPNSDDTRNLGLMVHGIKVDQIATLTNNVHAQAWRSPMASTQPNASLEDAVLWSYRLLLGREPETAQIVQTHAKAYRSVDEIRRIFIHSDEFAGRMTAEGARVPNSEVLVHFPPWTGQGEQDVWFDFLGVKTRCKYLPEAYAVLSGEVEGPPGTERIAVHETAEWIGTLRSVLEARARGSLVVVELGAGWGPWLVGAAKAAERVGIRNVLLAGVEGAQSHFDFMLQHFRDNGLDPNAHVLIRGVVGARDGTAHFPKLTAPSDEWGAIADYSNSPAAGTAFEEVRCVALTTLVDQLPPVDLIHCDLQGSEYDVLTAARATLSARVRRVVVGTHSRRIEADLLDFFAGLDWRLEDEGVCRLVQHGGRGALGLVRDGYQVWVNPHAASLK